MADAPLAGLPAIVTGAAHGIGLAIAQRLTADGAKVMAARLPDEPEPEIDGAAHFAGDLSDEATAQALVDATVAAFGGVAILVNNAGGGVIRPFLEHTPETLKATIDRNLWTAIWCCRVALPVMKAAGFGRIVNIGADSVRTGLFGHAAYNAAKGGMHAMAAGLAREFGRDGVTVNTVAPCATNTAALEVWRTDRPADYAKFVDVIPLGRPAETGEISGLVAFLCGPDGGFVTGQTLSVNGGSAMP
jgi:2,3-dihydroxy-2,3-dihydro-p-cumate dehydrogenase